MVTRQPLRISGVLHGSFQGTGVLSGNDGLTLHHLAPVIHGRGEENQGGACGDGEDEDDVVRQDTP